MTKLDLARVNAKKQSSNFRFFDRAVKFAVIILLSLCSSNALSTWYEVSSAHFVIYANQNQKTIEKFADRLERYHDSLDWFFGRTDSKPSPSNRVTIYVVGSQKEVRALYGGGNRYVAGFYSPNAGRSFAVVPRISRYSDDSYFETILLHEYAHHYQYNLLSYSYPLWFSEGFAEFFSSVKFEKDGGMGIGLPAYHRAYELATSKEVPLRLLLDTNKYRQKKQWSPSRHDSFYGKSWALFHLLQFTKAREGQWREYLSAIESGVKEIPAATKIFGDLDVLEEELDRYIVQPDMPYVPLPASIFNPSDITTRRLSKAEAKLMPLKIELRVSANVDKKRAEELTVALQAIAKKHSEDAAVWLALSEAAYLAENSELAIKWAGKALNLDNENIDAHIQKAFSMRQAIIGGSKEISWKDFRMQAVRANRRESENPLPLWLFYEGYIAEGKKPTENSISGLMRALALAPFDGALRMGVARQFFSDRRYQDTIAVLKPLVYHPHDFEAAETAKLLVDAAKKKLLSTQGGVQ